MKTYLDTPATVCCASAGLTSFSCCARYTASENDAPDLAASLADLTERAAEFVITRLGAALKAAATSRQ